MTATVFYDDVNEIALISNTFTDAGGVPADPTAVSCIITDPANVAVTHTYAGLSPADVIKVGTGKYTLSVACSPSVPGADGLWGFAWVGTGAVSDVQPGTWRVLPAAASQLWYVGLEEMNDRLGITDATDNSNMQFAIAASSGWLNSYCGRHFNRITETRTFVPQDIYELRIDDVVSVSTFKVDFDGDGTYEQPWVQNTDYQLYLGKDTFNTGSTGQPRPYEHVRVINSGVTFPYLWPLAPVNRVQIAATWGWPAVPWQVPEACRILSADVFKSKDAPFGVAGVSDIGIARIQSNPWLVELLRPFIRGRKKVGV
jgi:hypothetical protein